MQNDVGEIAMTGLVPTHPHTQLLIAMFSEKELP
jgi:hypothetical protein